MHAHNDTATNTAANAQHPFAALTPDVVLDALASVGLYGDGRLMALSSYENRVYQVTLEDGQRVVAKFYRPERWSQAQILEEHAFAAELTAAEVPAVGPLVLSGSTLHTHGGFPSRSAPGAAGAGPSWTTLRCWSGLAAFWRASTPWGRRSRLRTARRSPCRPLVRIRATGCWPTRSFRWTCNRPGKAPARTLLN